MTRVPVQSANIRAIGYDALSQTLEIEFVTGDVYAFEGVPPMVHRELMTAASIGKYFAMYIKGKYEFKKTEGAKP